MTDFWNLCLDHFREKLNTQQFTTWICPLSIQGDERQLVILAPNRFVAQWVKDKYLSDISMLASNYFAEAPRLSVEIAQEGQEALRNRSTPSSLSAAKPSEPEVPKHMLEDSRLNPLFTFDNLICGKANELARAAGLQIAENMGKGYNPLFIYGGVGLGKTHLMQAIGNQALTHNLNIQVRYIHAERYVSDMVKAFRHRAFEDFKRKYENLDLLLIDDIQFFAGKSRTQEEFFYVFNNLIENGKQVIITSDSFPNGLEGVEERLKSRFGWGLTVQLEPPGAEMRVAILLSKAHLEHENLDETTAFFIAKHIRSNVRELEGALKRVIAYSRFHQQPISIDMARGALKDVLAVQRRQIAIENIQKTVADYYKLRVADLFSKSRKQQIVRPRQVAMHLTKELTNLSLPEIGASFGGRDHSTVLHAVRKIEELRSNDQNIRRDYSLLLQVLQG